MQLIERKYMLKGFIFTVLYIISYVGITLFTMDLAEYKIIYTMFLLLQIFFFPIMFIGFPLMMIMHYLGNKFSFLSFLVGKDEVFSNQYLEGSVVNYVIIVVVLCLLGALIGYLIGKKKEYNKKSKG